MFPLYPSDTRPKYQKRLGEHVFRDLEKRELKGDPGGPDFA